MQLDKRNALWQSLRPMTTQCGKEAGLNTMFVFARPLGTRVVDGA
jgi:hypothetical protein